LVTREDPELKALMDQFVCVRRVQMGGVDLNVFQFDPFVSWSIFFMRADKTIYGRFGTASPQAKRSVADSNPNHGLAGLKAVMRRALAFHADYAKDPAHWKTMLAAKTGSPPPWRFAEKTPAAKKYGRLKRVRGSDTNGCIHCHEVARTQVDSAFMTKRPVTDRLLWVYPLPETMGVTFNKDEATRVTAVRKGSQAAEAGVAVGDDVLTFGGQPLLSPADFQWVLQQAPDKGGPLPLEVRRDGKTLPLTLTLAKQWRRKTDFCWRYRLAGYAMWLWGGVTLRDGPAGVEVAARAPGWFKRFNREARKVLHVGDTFVEVDGRRDWTRSTYLAYLMREKKPGSRVVLKVRRGGKVIDVTFRVPKKRPEVQGY